jgi:formylglycine-generating enzyme required for sulfatase activity
MQYRLVCLLVLSACAPDVPARVIPDAGTVALIEQHRDPSTWEALGSEEYDGWPRRARDPRTGIRFVLVEPGEFQMGDNRLSDEGPVHPVRISRPFYLAETELTLGQWRLHVDKHGGDPSVLVGEGDESFGASGLSWNDAAAYCALYGFELPTEAQWEYACRAGAVNEEGYWQNADTLDKYAWSGSNSGSVPHATASLAPNAWGLYDMLGGLWEWCADGYRPGYQVADPALAEIDPRGPTETPRAVLRGGSWFTSPPPRPSDRSSETRDVRSPMYGLRVARSLPAK